MTTESAITRNLNYAYLYGGITAAVFGIVLLIKREEAVGLIMVLLGLWWLVYGAFMLFSVFIDRAEGGWHLFLGALGVGAGLVTLSQPVETAQVLGAGIALVLGALGLVIGVGAIWGAFQGGGLGALVFGVVSAIIGLIFIFNPMSSASATVTLLAILLLINGLVGIYIAITKKAVTL